jgi:hypothetical protein
MNLTERASAGNGNFVLAAIGLLDIEGEPELTVLTFSRYSKRSVRRFLCGQALWEKQAPYMNFSNLSFLALQTGQISGGSFRAQR